MKAKNIIFVMFLFACHQGNNSTGNVSGDAGDTRHDVSKNTRTDSSINTTSLIVLGTLQDGGSPHAGCKKNCCKDLFLHPDVNRQVVCLGIIDPENKMNFLFEATPDLPRQMKNLQMHSSFSSKETPDAIFITHAHIGHYTGLMYLGKEAMNTDKVPVYVMPRMKKFLETNGPWSQLVSLKNIELRLLMNGDEPTHARTIEISSNLKVTSFIVPHRDEYSETIGFMIDGPHKTALFIPDIDKWEKWNNDILEVLKTVDYAFIDGTFYDGAEINNRDLSEIPHPFITESMEKFRNLPADQKNKIHFIHFNHTNPVLDTESDQYKSVLKNGFHIALMNMILKM